MSRERLVSLLRCPACHTDGPRPESEATLRCGTCDAAYAVVRGMPILDVTLDGDDPEASARELEARRFGTRAEFDRFLRLKARRPAVDAYAAWQPFNESTRAVLPLLPWLRELLEPGDVVVDLWPRSLWTAEVLAGLLPEQQIVAVMEGGVDVLGYRGVTYWLDEGDRADNLDILFHDASTAQPLRDGAAALVHGYDTLHRFPDAALLPEALRLAGPTGTAVFPHVHMANSQPDPFFERGGHQIDGATWQSHFDALADPAREMLVFSERSLFDAPAGARIELVDDADTPHYNGLILVTPRQHLERPGTACAGAPRAPDARVLVNPMLALGRMASVRPDAMQGGTAHLLRRHPLYAERIEAVLPHPLHATDRRLLHHAALGATVGELAERIGLDLTEAWQRLDDLEAHEVVQVRPVTGATARLQRYFSQQRAPVDQDLIQLWTRTCAQDAGRPVVRWPQDGSAFAYEDADLVARMAAGLLRDQGVEAGDAVVLESTPRPEVFFLIWGTWLLGATAVPIDAGLGDDARTRVLRRVGARRVWLAEELADLIGGAEPIADVATVSPPDRAAILFTSGSTGLPKGVQLAHGALARSAALVVETWGWTEEDRFLATGGFHTMSGLRNALIAVVSAGASVVLPPPEALGSPAGAIRVCEDERVTLLNTVPAFLSACLAAGPRALKRTQLRAILCTGAPLPADTARQIEEQSGVPVRDYYGLTETCGLCMADALPCGAALAVVDERGAEVADGEVGELVVHSANVMLGYLDAPEATQARVHDGWLWTGDRARRSAGGEVTLVGRLDRLIVDRHGENIQPEAVESALRACVGVDDAWVCAVPDRYGQPRIAAAVAMAAGDPRPGWQDALRRAVNGALSERHVPERLVATSSLPLNAAGKPDGRALRTLLESNA